MTEIESLINRLSAPTDNEIAHYFKKKYRGRYYTEMKCMVIHLLKSKGIKNTDIAFIVYGLKYRHDVVDYYLKLGVDHISDVVKEKYIEWINAGLYPISVSKFTYQKGVGYIKCLTEYKLERK